MSNTDIRNHKFYKEYDLLAQEDDGETLNQLQSNLTKIEMEISNLDHSNKKIERVNLFLDTIFFLLSLPMELTQKSADIVDTRMSHVSLTAYL